MALWPLRKINAYIFRAGYTANASAPSWWPTRVPTAFGMMLVCFWQTLVVIGTLFAVCGAFHLRVRPHFAFWLVGGVIVSLVVLNYVTLVSDSQWRQLTRHIRGHSEDDWMMIGLLLVFCALGFGALLLWLMPPVIEYSR
jgi:hypothetical protein